MSRQKQTKPAGWLLTLLLAYTGASLFHYVHNAVFFDAYPNLPPWLSSARVYAAWLGVAAIGLAGYRLLRRGHRLAGLAVIAVYGALGLDGLAHYTLAPFSAHTFTMNLTILLEAATATLLLIGVALLMLRLAWGGEKLACESGRSTSEGEPSASENGRFAREATVRLWRRASHSRGEPFASEGALFAFRGESLTQGGEPSPPEASPSPRRASPSPSLVCVPLCEAERFHPPAR